MDTDTLTEPQCVECDQMTSIMTLLGVIGLLVLTVSGDSIGDDRELFTLALTLQSSTNVDIGQDAFNRIFWNSPQHILKRECSSCGSTHRVIYYKRYTELNSFNLYQSTYDWQSTHNVLGVDFNLFSTLQDALADTNPWTYCNYDDPNIGMFRDCGPTGGHGGEWTSRTRGGDAAAFYIYTGLGGGAYRYWLFLCNAFAFIFCVFELQNLELTFCEHLWPLRFWQDSS